MYRHQLRPATPVASVGSEYGETTLADKTKKASDRPRKASDRRPIGALSWPQIYAGWHPSGHSLGLGSAFQSDLSVLADRGPCGGEVRDRRGKRGGGVVVDSTRGVPKLFPLFIFRLAKAVPRIAAYISTSSKGHSRACSS